MAKQNIDIGVEGNDGTGDSIRESFRKVNENFSELYAVFGIGGQISYTDLSDTPNTYEGNENKVPTVRGDGSGINFLELASDFDLNGTTDTIGFDFSVDGKLIIKQLVSKVSNDPEPILSGPLNASGYPIANIKVDQDALEQFNNTYGTDYDLGSLVIDKNFADRNYQQKSVAGDGLRIGDEPTTVSQYTLTATGIALYNLTIPGHGLSQAFNGAPFVFRTTGTEPFGVNDGGIYYIRVVDANSIGLYETEQDAVNDTAQILLSGGSGTFTITDGAYDEDLEGNWLDNEALPRKSIVRRQGDQMEGVLHLSDHPGELSGFGLPNGPDDLQAATKLYVDNAAATSEVNLYVSQTGSDRQENTPRGREGRNPAYAYRTINAAARKAEEIILSAPFEPGPYMQTMTYNTGAGNANIVTAGITSPINGRTNARTLILENKEFIQKEVTSYIDATYPDFAGSYNVETCQRDIGYILEAVTLDALLGNNANYLSRWSGFRYFSNPSAQKAIGSQYTETVAGIEYAKNLVVNYILTNTAVPITYQDRVTQYIEPAVIPDSLADNAIGSKFDIVLDIINNGVLDAPSIVDGQTTYKINVNNGNFGFIDQANPENTDIIPGKVVRGKNSGALARIIDYKYESGPRAVSVAETDEIEVQLLKPIVFEPGEELEYGNIVRETQVTLLVESGIYYEDYPIRVPNNVTILGDEFRRVLIRPKQRVSQSRYAGTFFYRDSEFDGLVLGRTEISTINSTTPADSNRIQGEYIVGDQDYTSTGVGKDAIFTISVNATGAITNIEITASGKDWRVGDLITVPDSQLGEGGATDVIIEVTSVPNGVEYINPTTGKVDGYFGYHYLRDPSKLKNTGAGYRNIGEWETAALTLIDNREFIQEQVVEYVEATYPALVGNYSRATCMRDAGLIVDALVKDLRNGGNEFALEAQGQYYLGAVEAGTETETVDGIKHIATIVADLFANQQPTNVYGINLDYPTADLFNGSAAPADWEADNLYRVGNVIQFYSQADAEMKFYQCNKEHTSGSGFGPAEAAAYWTEVFGPVETVENLLGTVTFGLEFPDDYNPPLRNDDMDVFLMNDATRVSNVTVQGHGGFMVVLDPEGQVLTKSPYIQVGSSFSRSQNKQVFSGGMFIDAFTGNSAVQVIEKVDGSAFRLKIKSLPDQGLFIRKPETPSAFYIDGRRFQVNAITQYDPDFGTAEIILDQNSNDGAGFAGTTSSLITGVNLDTIGTFEFDEDKCERDTLYILEGLGYDVAFGTNYNSVLNGLSYRRSYANEVIDNQITETLAALAVAESEVLALTEVADSAASTTAVGTNMAEIYSIINGNAPAAITWSDPGTDANKRYTRELLQLNRDFIATELTAWIAANQPGNTYDPVACERDTQYIVDAISYDIQYGGNTASIRAAQAYYEGAVSILPADQRPYTVAAFEQLRLIVDDIITEAYAGQTANGGNIASATEQADAGNLIGIIINVIDANNVSAVPTKVYPVTAWAPQERVDAKNDIDSNSTLIAHRTVQSVNAPLPITLQTAGNRSMLGNDFTQVNDLGYGLVCVNGALSEMVSMFTYYCWTSYYAKNGSEIRSVTGSSCYGEYGLVAEGSDPNEIPDSIVLLEDMNQAAKTFAADVVITTTAPVTLVAGDVLTQDNTGATGTVVVDTSTGGSYHVYLIDTNGSFNTTDEIQVTAGPSSPAVLGPDSVPEDIDATGYGNNQEQLSVHVYDMKDAPSNRSEFDVYHPERPAFARYEVANAELVQHVVGQYQFINTTIPATTTATDPTAAGAIFNLNKTITDGYTPVILNGGTNYTVGDTLVVLGSHLGGVDSTNDATITVDAVNATTGAIEAASATGTIRIEETTPKYTGQVYKLNFSTSDVRYSTNGLLNEIGWGVFINYRRNQTHILGDIARPDVLTIRPSTAVVFDENPGYVYRSISFLTSNSIGEELGVDEAQAGFDETYDYIRLIVESVKAQETANAGAGTTKGGTAGDVVIAVQPTVDANEVYRLNNNNLTPEANRPIGWQPSTLVSAPLITWGGKKFYVYNYRGADSNDNIVAPAEDNAYGIVDILEAGDDINQANSTGLSTPVVLGGELVTLRAGLKAGANGNVTINISTCRATAHDFLDVGTGGFNQSNYPNVIFGLPREADQAKEVDERGKGRVFYVSTDQNGIFRVGRFFSVDQGTGTVTFSASLALSDVDGIGFKRGVVVTEFSTDTAMTDNASDTVPTESAVRGYVNRRLGYDSTGAPVANKIGPGVLAPNGAVPMTDDLNAAGNTITNLKAPETNSDAATKAYVDSSGADNDTIPDFRDTEINDIDEGQLLVSTGYKKLFLSSGSVVSAPFERGDIITGTITGATGTLVDVFSTTGFEGDLTVLVYTPTSVTQFNTFDVVTVTGGAQGSVVDGPVDEWANGVWNVASDIVVSTNREVSVQGSEVIDRHTTINMQIAPNTINNGDISATAGIVQSKLSLNAATTRANATGITQADLGVASFDDARFEVTDGWVTVKAGSVPLSDIEQIDEDFVLGRSLAGTGAVSPVSFSTVIDEGGGLLDSDFAAANIIPAGNDPGEALIKTGAGTYGISNVTTTGEVNSIIKSDANGSIQVNSLILGGDSSYEILALDGTTVEYKTPAQGLVFSATGDGSTTDNGNVTLNVAGSINVAGTGVGESALQNTSNFNGEPVLAVDWIYSSFIEAPGEKGTASTGIAIGANTGKSVAGEVAIITGDSTSGQSVSPMKFTKDGMLPDVDSAYNIGSATRKYDEIFANLFRGTATEAYYADLAENYLGDADYEPGTVVVFGGDQEVTVCTSKGQSSVAGVVTTNPAHLMNSGLEGDHIVGIALQGRVPCKVIGKVKKGDMLVTSGVPGYAIVNNNPTVGTVIGKAVGNKDDQDRGVVEVVVGKH
jgi:hypothetical protein